MVEIISRAEWGARPPKTAPRAIPIPTRELWLHHTASPTGFAARVRSHQNYHMDVKGWNDIAYSFLINHEGDVYQGRGPGVQGGHTKGHNLVSHAICLMGNFNSSQPTAAALASLKELVRFGFESGWWPQTITGGHRDTRGAKPLDCPGDNVYGLIPAINNELVEDDMPLSDDDVRKVAKAAAGEVLGTLWSPTASVLQAVGRTYERSILGSESVSDAELEAAVDELIATVPQRTLDLLKQKL